MAHRQIICRLWTVTMKEIHCLAESTAATSTCFSTTLQSTKNRSFFLSASHSITLVSNRRASFNVQDKEDFTERVINSQTPVLIDFHAQWVLQGGMIVDHIGKRKYVKWAGIFDTAQCTSRGILLLPFRHFSSTVYPSVGFVFIASLFQTIITPEHRHISVWFVVSSFFS